MKSTFNHKKFHKAQRERKRMHSLNEALEILRRKLQDSICDDLKLPKIETLKLGRKFDFLEKLNNFMKILISAKNYIKALEMILKNENLSNYDFVSILCDGMRHGTSNVLKRFYF